MPLVRVHFKYCLKYAVHNEQMLEYFASSSLLILQFSKEYFTTVETEVSVVLLICNSRNRRIRPRRLFFVALKCTSNITFTSSPGGKPAVTALNPRKLLG